MSEIKQPQDAGAAADVELKRLEFEAESYARLLAPTIINQEGLLRLVEGSLSDDAVNRVLRYAIRDLQWLLENPNKRYGVIVEQAHPGYTVVQ